MNRILIVILGVACGCLPLKAAAQNSERLPISPHFHIEAVASGVWAAIASDSGYAVSNAGIVDLGDKTLIFDPFMSPEAAVDLRLAAEELTGRTVDYVALSHWHNDHIRGAQSFPGARILGSSTTRSLIALREPLEIEREHLHVARFIEITRARLDTITNPDRRSEALFWASYYEAMQRSHDLLVLTLPDLTFEERMILHGEERTAELIELDGHTESDVVLWLPNERVIFMADLLFIERHPYLPDGNPDDHRATLLVAGCLQPDRVVPGHGPVDGPASLDVMINYIDAMEQVGQELAASNAEEEEIRIRRAPEPYDTWWYGNFVPANMRFMTMRARDSIVTKGVDNDEWECP